MTAFELNAAVYREIGEIADNENLMTKVLNYVRGLKKKKERKPLDMPVDKRLEKELDEIFKDYPTATIPEEELAEIVSDARREVYGEKK